LVERIQEIMGHQLKIFTAVLLLFLAASCSSGPTGPQIDLSNTVIVAFGNSITAGVGDTARPPGYPYRLEQMLRAAFPNVIVLNRGVSGERTEQGVRRIDRVLTYDQPDYVLILEGVNNIGEDLLETVAADLEVMVQKVKASGAIPLIASLTPTAGEHVGKMEGINGLNPLIRDIAAREQIVFVDLYTAFFSRPDYSLLLNDDGLHPNNGGYTLMADTWHAGLLGKL